MDGACWLCDLNMNADRCSVRLSVWLAVLGCGVTAPPAPSKDRPKPAQAPPAIEPIAKAPAPIRPNASTCRGSPVGPQAVPASCAYHFAGTYVRNAWPDLGIAERPALWLPASPRLCELPASQPTTVLATATRTPAPSPYDGDVLENALVLRDPGWPRRTGGPHEALFANGYIGPERYEGWWLRVGSHPNWAYVVVDDGGCVKDGFAVAWGRSASRRQSKDLQDALYAYGGRDTGSVGLWFPPEADVPGTWWIWVALPSESPGPLRVAMVTASLRPNIYPPSVYGD